MTDIDFRKAYAAEVKASAESKKHCSDLIEWTELQRQTALSSHAGQLRNTLAFKAEVDLLVRALQKIAALVDSEAGEPLDDAIKIANDALSAVSTSGSRDNG